MLLRSIELERSGSEEFPFTLKSLKNFRKMVFGSNVTFFVGENGSGKSTLLEAIALGCRLPTVGSIESENDNDFEVNRRLTDNLKYIWSLKSGKGFFMRAEDFFGFIKRIKQMSKSLNKDRDMFDRSLKGYGHDLAVGSVTGQIRALESRYGDLAKLSHGEGFLTLFQSRMTPNGLYLLDEPEAALSPLRQMSLISLMKEMANKNCQFIIATHSPILTAFPGATIFGFDEGIRKIKYEEIEHVSLTKKFLNSPEVFTSKL